MSRRPILAVLAAVATLAAGDASAVRGQGVLPPNDARVQFALRTEALKWVLKDVNLEAVRDPRDLARDPEHSILIVLGRLDGIEAALPDRMGIAGFLARGGAVLVANDQRVDQPLRGMAEVTIDGAKLQYIGPLGGKKCHLDQRDRPFVVPATSTAVSGHTNLDNPFTGFRVATNNPSYLTIHAEDRSLAVLARLPENTYEVWPDLPPLQPEGKGPLPFAVGGASGKGRLLVLADHSVFINEMMLSFDCDNFNFTLECLDWLGVGGARTRAMLVDGGEIAQTFDVQLRQLPTPPPLKVLEQLFLKREEILEEAQRRIVRAEETNGINRGLLRGLGVQGDGRGMARLQRLMLWILGGGVLGVVLYRLSNEGRYLPEKRLPPLAAAVAGQRPTATATEQRPRAQLRARNLWESARELARHHLSPTAAGPLPPPYPQVGGGWRHRRRARQRLERLWAVAYGDAPIPVPPHRWEEFLADLEAFDRDVSDGTITLPAVA